MRLIDADALLKIYKNWLPQLIKPEDAGDRNGVETCIAVLEDAPTIDAEPVRHGRWELVHKELSECSACGMIRNIRTQFAWAYCPNCGAKMDLEVQENV
jgi:hypothetical protein